MSDTDTKELSHSSSDDVQETRQSKTPEDLELPSSLDVPDSKGSRKREREVSIEPATPKDEENETEEVLERRTPAKKKNRLVHGQSLASTSEEDVSAQLEPTPAKPGETPRVQQLRERVRELSWHESTNLDDTLIEKDEQDTPPANVSNDLSIPSPPNTDSTTRLSDQDQAKTPQQTTPTQPEQAIIEPTPVITDGQPDTSPSADPLPTAMPSTPTRSPPRTPPPKRAGSGGSDGGHATNSDGSEPDAEKVAKSLKRKHLAREANASHTRDSTEPADAEPVKRARDDSGAKSPSRTTSPQRAKSKLSGFSAYNSTSSPFAALAAATSSTPLSSSPPSKPSGFAAFTGVSPFASFSSNGSQPSSQETPKAFSGFLSYAASPSPFASRKKSPPPSTTPKLGSAFGSYSNSPARFGSPTADVKKKRGPNDSEPSFGDILASQEKDKADDDEHRSNKLAIEAVEVITGEEDEITVQSTRAKLYTLDAAHNYKERGTGTLKINVRRTDGLGARLVMRAEGVYRLILNTKLFNGMSCSVGQDPKFVKLSVMEGGVPVHHAIRVRDAKIAQEFVDQIHANIPSNSPPPTTDTNGEV